MAFRGRPRGRGSAPGGLRGIAEGGTKSDGCAEKWERESTYSLDTFLGGKARCVNGKKYVTASLGSRLPAEPTYLLGGSEAACAAAPTYLPPPVYTPARYVTSKRTKRSGTCPCLRAGYCNVTRIRLEQCGGNKRTRRWASGRLSHVRLK